MVFCFNRSLVKYEEPSTKYDVNVFVYLHIYILHVLLIVINVLLHIL